MYNITPKNFKQALELAQEYNYELKDGKIPIGVFYKHEKPVLEEKWPILARLKKLKKNWRSFKK